jgi:SRSO17 transposase
VEAGCGSRGSQSGSGSRFTAYVEALSWTLGHVDRDAPFRSYGAGLLLPGDGKSVEPMAARVEPGRVQATHQSAVNSPSRSNTARMAAVSASVTTIISGNLAMIAAEGRRPKGERCRCDERPQITTSAGRSDRAAPALGWPDLEAVATWCGGSAEG